MYSVLDAGNLFNVLPGGNPITIISEVAHQGVFQAFTVDSEGFVFVPHGIAGNANNPLNEVTRIVGRYKDHDIASSWLLTFRQLQIQHGHFHPVGHFVD